MNVARWMPTAALAVLTACSPLKYERSAADTMSDSGASIESKIPDSAPMREPFTSYFRILRGDVTVGYAVRYDPVPAPVKVERHFPTGTQFVEDTHFHRVGFLTEDGHGFRYDGADLEPVGQGTLEYLLPKFFAGDGFKVVRNE